MKMKSIGTLIKLPLPYILIVLALIFVLLLSSNRVQGSDISVVKQIIEVVDGNTLRVTTVEGDTLVVQLKGVDAPELGQEFAQESITYLKKLVIDQTVEVEFVGKDQWGIRLVSITNKKSQTINDKMIVSGMGWVDRFYLMKTNLMTLQEKAKAKNIGLWKQESPIQPWVYFRNKLSESPKER